jgi:hypothetical protein
MPHDLLVGKRDRESGDWREPMLASLDGRSIVRLSW